MRCYPEAGEFVPLFICGLPRAGTRFVTDALNLSPEVAIHGEVFDESVEAMRQMFSDLDPQLERRDRTEAWNAQKQHLLTAIWANASKSAPKPVAEECRFYGFKTPLHERFFDFYEGVFSENPPLWVFNVRNFRDLYRSLSSMRWRKGEKETIGYIGAEYLKAMDDLDRMMRAAPGRVFPFVLDNYTEDEFGYLRSLLEGLGLSYDDALLDKMVGLGARNSARSKGIEKKDISSADEAWIQDNRAVLDRFSAVASEH